MALKKGPLGSLIPDREAYGTLRVTKDPQIDDVDLFQGRKRIAASELAMGFKRSNQPMHDRNTIAESNDNRGLGKVFKPKGRR